MLCVFAHMQKYPRRFPLVHVRISNVRQEKAYPIKQGVTLYPAELFIHLV